MSATTTRLLALMLLMLCAAVRAEDGLLDERPQDNELAALESQAAQKRWWNPQWTIRRRVNIVDPAFRMQNIVFLDNPSPLFLYNTGRCRDALADLRVVDSSGRLLRSGVINFGQDDGTGFIWFVPRTTAGPATKGTPATVWIMLYYGNPKARPTGDRLPRWTAVDAIRPVEVTLGDEETVKGRAPLQPPAPGAFFKDLVVVEAEDLRGPDGQRPTHNLKRGPAYLFPIEAAEASGGRYIAPTIPWRPYKRDYPCLAHATVNLPSAGTWYLHVRYRVTARVGRNRRVTARYYPFTIRIGGREFACGKDQSDGALFRYDSTAIDLSASEHRLDVRMGNISGPDAFIFTRSKSYRPDIGDLSGPVWMRFKIEDVKRPPFFVDLFCVNVPWSSHGPQGETACWLFRDRAFYKEMAKEAMAAGADKANYVRPGEWSAWGRALHSVYPLWWSQVRFLPAVMHRPASMSDLDVRYEFATRPAPERVFSAGTGRIRSRAGLMVMMPSALDLNTVVSRTMTFGTWARRRFENVQALGFGPDAAPRKILISTQADAWSPEGARMVLKTMNALGFNTLSLKCRTDDKLPDLFGEYNVPYMLDFRFVHAVPLQDVPLKPAKGLTCAQTIHKAMEGYADETWRGLAQRKAAWQIRRTRLLKTGDEIGPMTSHHFINAHPVMLGYFREWLRAQGRTPEFFGAKSWDEIKAVGYRELGDISRRKLEAVMRTADTHYDKKIAAEEARQEDKLFREGNDDAERAIQRFRQEENAPPPPAVDGAAAPAQEAGDPDEVAAREEERKAVGALDHAAGKASVFEKRLYHYTQKFRTHYTCVVFRAQGDAIARYYPNGGPLAAPNFQAMPAMRGQMWDGALDIWDFARSGCTNALWLEDWTRSANKVAFGMTLLKAAARKRGQPLIAYVVGGRVMNRALVDVALGCRGLSSYLYGPLRVIGPPWAESEPTIRAYGALDRWIARHEDELLNSETRPCDAAILVANTSEINSACFPFPLFDRVILYTLLQAAHVPIDVVGEEEVIEDNALERYRVLYAVDPHVDSRAQAKIRDWVRDGGVLWAGYGAFARREFDEPSTTLDEVFGLRKRPPIEACPFERTFPEGPLVTVKRGDGLSALKFHAIKFKPAYPLSTGRALASFADGSPAIMHNRFGKGQAWLNAYLVGSLTGGYGSFDWAEPDADKRPPLLTAAADAADVRRQVSCDDPDVLTFVRDGKGFTILFLINRSVRKDLKGVRAQVVLPAAPRGAEDGAGEPVKFVAKGNTAAVTVDLPNCWGEMIVFRY